MLLHGVNYGFGNAESVTYFEFVEKHTARNVERQLLNDVGKEVKIFRKEFRNHRLEFLNGCLVHNIKCVVKRIIYGVDFIGSHTSGNHLKRSHAGICVVLDFRTKNFVNHVARFVYVFVYGNNARFLRIKLCVKVDAERYGFDVFNFIHCNFNALFHACKFGSGNFF